MEHLDSTIDADFYRLIHQLAGTPREDDPSERRGQHRQAFSTVQRIAPHPGPGFPPDSEFFEVRCHDLTRSGFSFFLPAPPDFTALVAAFGTPPHLIYVGAEVRHSDRVLRHPSGLVEHVGGGAGAVAYQSVEGNIPTPLILVGCRFTRRMERPFPAGR